LSRAPAHPLPSPCAWCLYLLKLGDRVPWFLKFDVVPARLGTVGSDHHPHVDGALDSSSSSSVPRRASSAPAIPAQIHPYPWSSPSDSLLCARAISPAYRAQSLLLVFLCDVESLRRVDLSPSYHCRINFQLPSRGSLEMRLSLPIFSLPTDCRVPYFPSSVDLVAT
jgi:hypothetical protein